MTIRKLAILLFATIVLASSCQTVDAVPDYSDSSYWAYYGEGNADGVDLFMVCPCVDMGRDGRLNMMLSDEDAKASFVGALNMERGIYDGVALMYAPFYRQMTFPVFEQGISTSGRDLARELTASGLLRSASALRRSLPRPSISAAMRSAAAAERMRLRAAVRRRTRTTARGVTICRSLPQCIPWRSRP